MTALCAHTLRKRFLPAFTLVGTALVLSGCGAPTFGAFRGATTQGRDEFKLWVGMFIAGLAVAILVWALIFWAVIAYRRKDDTIPRQFHAHIPLEITYTLIPLIMVFVIFYFTVATENEVDAVSSHPAEIVHVVAYRWGWQFTYYDGAHKTQGVTVGTNAEPKKLAQPATSSEYPQLVLPVGATVEIDLDSRDVIHGFYVPAFNFSRYAQPGYTNVFDFTTTTTGVFPGQCSQYCGLYHAEMIFNVKVESSADFANWMKNRQAAQASTGGTF
jgi:cytochrome c oxidase subunit 2